MKQIPVQLFESDCGKSRIIVDNDMPLGQFHDFLLRIKGMMVDKMVEVQKQEQQLAEQQASLCSKEEGCQ